MEYTACFTILRRVIYTLRQFTVSFYAVRQFLLVKQFLNEKTQLALLKA